MKAGLDCRRSDTEKKPKQTGKPSELRQLRQKFRDLQFKLAVPLSYSLEYDMTYLNLKGNV